MKEKLVAVTAILLSATYLFAQEDVSESKWQVKQIVIDGNDAEWSQPFNFFDNTSGLIFTMANDSKNLYLCFSNNDRAKTVKMMTAGWSLTLISSEKKRKFDASISFPKSVDPNINMRSDFKTAIGIYKAETQLVKTKGFLFSNGDLPLVNKNGMNIGIGADSTEKIVYEIAIPIKELMEEDKAQLNEVITLDITVNALAKPAAQTGASANSGGGSGFSGGGRGGGGGRMGGGRGGGGGARGGSSGYSAAPDRYAMFDKTSFKQKIRLVNK